MPLTAKARKLVIESWEQIENQEAAGVIWFRRLFRQCPQITVLYKFLVGYKEDPGQHPFLPQHAGQVMRKLDVSVHQLTGDLRVMVDDLRTLGSRHPGYGVNPFKHIAPTLEAFLYMLRQQLGDAFTPEYEDAWRRYFRLLTESMGLVLAK